MELLKEALKRLEDSEEFKEWKKEHKDDYFSSAFMLIEKEKIPWKVGYYNKEKNKVTSFVVGEKIEIQPEEEIFQKEKNEIMKVDMNKLKVELSNALVTANNLQQEKYKGDDPIKVIAILQHIDGPLVWNLIMITQKFNTLNIKINAETGEIIEEKMASIMDFRKADNACS